MKEFTKERNALDRSSRREDREMEVEKVREREIEALGA